MLILQVFKGYFENKICSHYDNDVLFSFVIIFYDIPINISPYATFKDKAIIKSVSRFFRIEDAFEMILRERGICTVLWVL